MDNLHAGQMLGPYRIINQVGKGGMATVYKAYQASVDRYVAIKVLPSQLAESKEFAARFQQEARIIARLEHPHILPVFDYGESDGIAYFVMRYLDAGTLKDKMEAGRPLPLSEIDRIFTQLTDALRYAHSQGIVHRDLKPANALVDSHGNIFLTDFGIAKLLESASPRLTQTNAIMGTPAYISPEQAQSQPVDRRSDIYSLGIILYEMVTGQVPFVADTPLAVLFKHISDPLPPPSRLRPEIPPAIEQVILKALAKDPRDRFATTDEFLTAWKHALDEKETVLWDEPTEIMPGAPPPAQTPGKPAPGAPTKISKVARPAGWIAGCLILSCVALTVVGGIWFVTNRLRGTSPTPPTDLPVPTQTQPVLAPTATVQVIDTGAVLLEDDFAGKSSWGTLTNTDNAIEYEGEALRMRVFKPSLFVWTTPNEQVYENIHVEVTAANNDGETTTAFGIMCHQQSSNGSYYYLAVTSGGEYTIGKALTGETDVLLTNNNRWAASGKIPGNAASYRVGADCGQGRLTLYVNGEQIDSISDPSYSSGYAGLFTWSGKNAQAADVMFDDFVIRSLE